MNLSAGCSSLTLPLRHAFPDEFVPVSSCNVPLHGLCRAQLAILFAQRSCRCPSFALPVGHALLDEFGSIYSCNILLHSMDRNCNSVRLRHKISLTQKGMPQSPSRF
jgi:hypothetical protein